MKKVLIIFLILISLYIPVFATDLDILKSQKESLGISDFIEASKEYTKETFEDIRYLIRSFEEHLPL